MVELTLVLGSTSDWKNEDANIQGQLEEITKQHDDLTVKVEFASAHNTPDRVPLVLGKAKVRPSGAGMSAALPGVIEAVHGGLYNLSVGIPISDKVWKGLPAFMSIAEMPPNNPVLCAGIDGVSAGMSMAYQLEKGPGRIVIAHLGVGDEQYAKLKGKFEAVMGEEVMKDESKVLDAGKLFYVNASKDKIPEEVKGSLVVTLGSGCGLRDNGAFSELDKVLAEHGGVHVSLNTGENVSPEDAYHVACQYTHCKATGTMAVGSVGYTNAAQFAARVMQWDDAIATIQKTKAKKAASLHDAVGYVVQKGETRKAA